MTVRVTLVTAHYPPKLSGHADFCQHLASSLVDEGLEVTVVVLGADEVTTTPGFDAHRGPFPGSRSELHDALDTIEATDPDVVCLQFEAHAFRLAWTPHLLGPGLRRRGLRTVMTYHELWKPGRFGHVPKAILLNSVDRVVGFSHWHAEGIDRYRRVGARADVIACSSNIVDEPTGDRRLLRARYDVPTSTFLLSFFGFIMREHKIEELLHALADLRTEGSDVQLQLIGRFDPTVDGYHQRLVDLAKDLRLDDVVTWHGRVMDQPDVARLLQMSDAGVLPYDTGAAENNGAFAAMAHYGLPTVTTRGERSAHMEAQDIAEFVEPTAYGLGAGLRRLLHDHARRDLLGKRINEWAERRSWERTGHAYARLLRGDTDHIEVI